jgi:hypothetical protein
MSENKAAVIMVFLSFLFRIVAFVCITIAAIYFQNALLLWWYILPSIMSCKVETGKDGAGE